MASNRDTIRAELNARKRGNSRGYTEEEDTSHLPDARDPEELNIARLMAGMDAETEEPDLADALDMPEYEDEDTEDDGWDGSTPPRKQPEAKGQRVQQEEEEESELDALRREAAQARTLNQLYARDPAKLAELLLQRMNPQDAARVMQSAGGQAQARVAIPPPLQIGEYQITNEDWAEMTPAEKVAWTDAQTLRNDIPQQFARIEQDVQRSELYRDFHVERLNTVLGVIAEVLGLEIEDADTRAIDRLLDQGFDMKTAVAEAYGKRLRAKVKEKTKGKPRTPQSRPGGAPILPKDATLNQIIAYQEKYGKLPE